MPPRYKPIDQCRREIEQYARHLDSGTDDGDDDKRATGSTRRYKQDMRWFDHWLDNYDIEDISNVTTADAADIGYDLSDEFNGTTARYRWDIIYSFYNWALTMEIVDSNPLEKWNDIKKEQFGLTTSTKQNNELKDGEKYAVSQDDIRAMENNVGEPRLRNQLLIRFCWQTGVRRGEASEILISDIDRENREVNLRSSITKNGKNRVVAYQPNLDGLLNQWIDGGYRNECLGKGINEDDEDDEDDEDNEDNEDDEEIEYLFVGTRGGQLRPEGINDVIKKAADNAGLNRRMYADANAATDEDGNKIKNRWKITAHNVRHGLGTYLVNETDMDLYSVSKYLGHSSVDITESTYVDYDPRVGTEAGARYGPD